MAIEKADPVVETEGLSEAEAALHSMIRECGPSLKAGGMNPTQVALYCAMALLEAGLQELVDIRITALKMMEEIDGLVGGGCTDPAVLADMVLLRISQDKVEGESTDAADHS